MKKILKNILLKFALSVFIAILMTIESAVFAWLSTGWSPGEFSIKGSITKTPTLEMWTYCKEGRDDGPGWYKEYSEPINTSVPEDKAINNICDPSVSPDSTPKIFKKAEPYSLYFGTINNLVDEQDNLPVYFKLRVYLPAGSSNKLKINYSLPANYLQPYLVNTATEVGTLVSDTTANENLFSKLNDKSNYPFLYLQCFYSKTPVANGSGYEITNTRNLPDGFESLFLNDDEDDNTILLEIEDKSNATTDITLVNVSSIEKYVNMYFKFSVPTSTLQKALFNTELKSNMPMYLIFNVNFSIDIETTSVEITSQETPQP